MKIVLVTFGSRWDVQPMLALSLALQRKGNDVLLVGPPEKAGWAGEYGCPFHPLGDNLTDFIDGMSQAYTIGSAFHFVAHIYKEVVAQFEVLPKIISGADLVVGASLVFALSSVAEHLGIPYRYIAFCPQLLPSGHHPVPAVKTQGRPHWFNRNTWKLRQIMDRLGLKQGLNNHRKNLGLKPIQDSWLNVLGRQVIVASDKEIAGIPEDVKIQAAQTGYMHLHQKSVSNPSLERFLEAGPPPIYAGFGSMPRRDQARNIPVFIEAARSAGQRVIIAKFWEGPIDFADTEDVLFLKGYPHLDLFPYMSMIVHHGGAGTTATAAVSGVPQIIVPHVLDQYYWGHQIYRARLGPKPIRRSRLTSQNLSTAMLECLSDTQMRLKAKEVSNQIQQRDSLAITAEAVLSS